jgi:hypothetical protein
MEPGGDSTTGCPVVVCWEKVAETQQKQHSYYDACDVTALACDNTDAEITEITDGTNYDEYGKIRSESITCVVFLYEILAQDTVMYTGEVITINRQYTEIGNTYVTYAPCSVNEEAILPAPTC